MQQQVNCMMRKKAVIISQGKAERKVKRFSVIAKEMVAYYEKLLDEFPIISIEDGLQEDDWEGWKQMTEILGEACTTCRR